MRKLLGAAVGMMAVYCLWGLGGAAAWAVVPAGFTDSLVAGIGAPTAIDFTPDGRALVTTQDGSLRVITNLQNATPDLLPTPALTIAASSICTESERGLLGVAAHPSFATNRFIYLFYTFETGTSPPCVNRVSRFTLPDSNIIDLSTELVLITNMPSPNGNHNAGDVQFGKDGFLYVSIGEGGVASAARSENVLTGKILRITDTGAIPPGNPFQGAGTASCRLTGSTTAGNRCQETFAWGFRNPFRIAFDPNDPGTRFFINDVGQSHWEEIDLAEAGKDYGWNVCEGSHVAGGNAPCTSAPPGMVLPIFEYAHGTTIPGTTSPASCNAITGGAFVPNGVWQGYDDAYLFADFQCGSIFRLTQSGGPWTASELGSGLGLVTHLRFGPIVGTQALYYATYSNGGQVRRVVGPPPAVPTAFHTLAPCRVVDTRQPAGPGGGPPLAGGVTRSFQIEGPCGVPAVAVAVAMNLTVVDPSAGGFLTVFPAGTAQPNASTLNFAAGQARANNAVVLLGGAGGLAVFAGTPVGSSTGLILDVVGYFQ